jgi:cytochrome b pre-mRNA-processing protein 3
MVDIMPLLHPASAREASENAVITTPGCLFLLKFVRCNDNSPLSMRRFALRQGAKPVNQLWLRCNRAKAANRAEREKPGMFSRFFGSNRRTNRAVTDVLYGEIVAAARQPLFYAAYNVPDTPLGRFEMLSLHLFLILHRLRSEEGTAKDIAQELTDEFFLDVDHSLRELGIGDHGIPRRVKKLGRMFYGRANAYGQALERGDRPALAASLMRNIHPEAESWPEAGQLADYALDAWEHLSRSDTDAFSSGTFRFERPDALEQTK